jgi:hypothetical protein
MTTFEGMTDEQLRSAIRAIFDPKASVRIEMIKEAKKRFLDSIDLSRTCQEGGEWFPFFKEIEPEICKRDHTAWHTNSLPVWCDKCRALVN